MKKIFWLLILWIYLGWMFCYWNEYSPELQQAYNWAYENKITTQNSIEKANLEWGLNRIAMAKMLSYYAINVLGKTPDTGKYSECQFNDLTPDLTNQYDNWWELSCQLWIMGIWIKDFRPFDTVTRAEFWTALSRVLWWDKYEWGSTYYENHLKTLKSEWIMNNISSPMNNEIRWRVMLMLMRSSWEEVSNMDNKTDADNQISDIIKMLD